MTARFRLAFFAAVLALCAAGAPVPSLADAEPWDEIRATLFSERAIAEDGSVKIFAPKRTEDAALVPVRILSLIHI